MNLLHLFHLLGGEGVVAAAAAVVAPPVRSRPECAVLAAAAELLVAGLVDGLVVVGELLGTVPAAAVQLQTKTSMER